MDLCSQLLAGAAHGFVFLSLATAPTPGIALTMVAAGVLLVLIEES